MPERQLSNIECTFRGNLSTFWGGILEIPCLQWCPVWQNKRINSGVPVRLSFLRGTRGMRRLQRSRQGTEPAIDAPPLDPHSPCDFVETVKPRKQKKNDKYKTNMPEKLDLGRRRNIQNRQPKYPPPHQRGLRINLADLCPNKVYARFGSEICSSRRCRPKFGRQNPNAGRLLAKLGRELVGVGPSVARFA